MGPKSLDRRDFMKVLGMTALGTASACTAAGVAATASPSKVPVPTIAMFPADTDSSILMPPTQVPAATQPSMSPQQAKKRVLRIAHMTDWHVLPLGTARDGMTRALRHAQAQVDPPDIIINTGDCVMDSLETDKGKVQAQWAVYKEILASECKLPIIHAIGNHDVWGWGIDDPSLESDPLYGKEMALEQLGLESRYYSFDRAGWHFVVLDSVHLRNKVSSYPYIGQLDDEQYQWFINDISSAGGATQTPVCIVSHIPVVAACEYFDGRNEESGNWVVPASWMHIDARRFRDLFVQNPGVRLCLSGHTHQYESLDYLGVRYITSGAICGDWWRGPYMDFPPAYVMVDLYSDGSADSTFVAY